ncbi:hypothetical protein GWP26_04390 [Corynebacterium macginleyi]|uniref:Secreted protein n=1 Tax=Corynebacterium macginleyi TaxID=38290 RepID=A0A3M0H220_9CORY|nr:hypothetical protein [Corynebacterium macginleyi]MBK4162750.1 hypothetical protein [Corynebacterium macginleyi]MBK4180137.1 hypothetical protein [Corynebacterium macginleyi]QRJ60187.1 hypothetical protein GWO70_000955 [Corynebacterium macginleyi]QRP21511.1 hypothetical protein I6J25_01210 [Corynebacterium macginleyi]
MPSPLKHSHSRTLACAAAFPLCMTLVSCTDNANSSVDSSEPRTSDAVAQSSSSSSSSLSSSTEHTTTTTDSPTTSPAETSAQPPVPQETAVAPITPQTKGDCSPSAFSPLEPNMGNIRVADCDGEWAHFGKANTDWSAWARFNNGAWTSIEPIGVTNSGLTAPCYDVDEWVNQGAPSFVADDMRRCD